MDYVLEIKNITKKYGSLIAVDSVSFGVKNGEVFGLVGESGCGKSTTARLVLRLTKPDEGSIIFEENDITFCKGKHLRKLRKKMQIVFQDPLASLNPRIRIGEAVAEPFLIHKMCGKKEVRSKVADLLHFVGLGQEYAKRYPHEISGGENQRICIARALATEPSFLVLDEPVSSLDAKLAAKIIDLLMDIKKKRSLTYLFITHDLALAKQICNRIAVMKQGRIIEEGPAEEIFNNPKEDYTKQLLADTL